MLRPIAFYSKKLAKAKKKYEIYNKEMLTIMVCLTKWRAYLEGAQPSTEVYTNNPNLTYFTTTKALNLQQVKWSEKLGGYNFRVIYRPGCTNLKTDLPL